MYGRGNRFKYFSSGVMCRCLALASTETLLGRLRSEGPWKSGNGTQPLETETPNFEYEMWIRAGPEAKIGGVTR